MRSNIAGLFAAGTAAAWVWFLLAGDAIFRIDHLPDRVAVFYRAPAWGLALFCFFQLAVAAALCARSRRNAGAVFPCADMLRLTSVPTLTLFCLALSGPDATTAGILYIFGAPLLWTWMLLRGRGEQADGPESPRAARGDALAIGCAFAVIYWGIGVYFTSTAGQHSGDEGHYLIQAQSLYHDRDLDLRNNLNHPNPAERERLHISAFSRGEAWYSWHSPGLSFLLAPTVPGGILLRHLALGLISGLGLAAVYLLARAWNAGRRWAWIATTLLGMGLYWGVYSSRALPEVLGATLLTWGYYFCVIQPQRPWASAILTACCVSLLPWAQTRFLPLALAVAGLYGLRGLRMKGRRRHTFARLAVFAVLCAAGLAAYQLVQSRLFIGGFALPPAVLFSYLPGAWHAIASERGILVSIPMLACAIAASITAWRTLPDRPSAWEPFALFALVLFTACATPWFTGGNTLPGRYLLVTTPILTACLARTLTSSGWGFRALSLYLGIIPVGVFLALLPLLPHVRRHFSAGYYALHHHALIERLPIFFYDPYAEVALRPAIFIYGGALLLAVWSRRATRSSLLLVAGILIAVAAHAHLPEARKPPAPGALAEQLKRVINQGGYAVSAFGARANPIPLFEHSDLLHGRTERWIRGVTQDTVAPDRVGYVSTDNVELNDWAGRPYRWATLVTPFRAGRGDMAILIHADASESTAVEIALREGRDTLLEQRYEKGSSIREVFRVRTTDKGDLYILARLDGAAGALHIHRISISPFDRALLRKARLHVDPPE